MSKKKKSNESKYNLKLAEKIAEFKYDPAGFVRFNYCWGEENTTLVNELGMENWQKKCANFIGNACKTSTKPVRVAVRAGHSVGKTAFTSWLIQWFISTRVNPQIIVTANTKTQLASKTWRELAKWHKLSLNKNWFTWTATRFSMKGHEDTWVAYAIPWSKENPEAFAGTHEDNVLVIMDEASSIPQEIWDTIEGAMASGNCIWTVFGNPTRTSGAFYNCFKDDSSWKTYEIDAERCEHTNKEQIKDWVDSYGEDSDFVRVRVRGLPPKSGINQVISREEAEAATKKKFHRSEYENLPKIMGVDLARYGDDKSEIAIRQGLYFTKLLEFHHVNGMEMAEIIGDIILKEKIAWCYIDLGYMPSVVDCLQRMNMMNVIGVNFGGSKNMRDADRDRFANNVSLIYWRFAEHIKKGGSIPNDDDLVEELSGREYGYNNVGKIQVEKKDDIKKRIKRSPDKADACALTFYNPELEKVGNTRFENESDHYTDYNPLGGF